MYKFKEWMYEKFVWTMSVLIMAVIVLPIAWAFYKILVHSIQ